MASSYNHEKYHEFICGLMKMGYESCHKAYRTGNMVKQLGFTALNINLITNKLGVDAETFSAIAEDIIEISGDLEKGTAIFLQTTNQFVECLLAYLKEIRKYNYINKTLQLSVATKSELAKNSANLNFLTEITNLFNKRLVQDKKNILFMLGRLKIICNRLLRMTMNAQYAANLARIEVSRLHVKQSVRITPSLKAILALDQNIMSEIQEIKEGLESKLAGN